MSRLIRATALVILVVATAVLAGSGLAEAKDPEGIPLLCVIGPGSAERPPLNISGKCPVKASAQPYKYGSVTIQSGGELGFSADGAIDFSATEIVIEEGGTLTVGTAATPIGKAAGSKVTLRFVGAPGPCPLVKINGVDDPTTDWCGKGILVKPGGTLRLYGAKGVPTDGVSWTHLAKAAGPTTDPVDRPGYVTGAKVPSAGDSVVRLAKDVTQGTGAWKANDWIAVATTSFSPFETEFVQIKGDPKQIDLEDPVTKVTVKGTELQLSQALKNYHFGGPDPGPPSTDNYRNEPLSGKGKKATVAHNYGVDERAEVGLISRSITLTAETDAANPHWGGEIKIMHGFTGAALQGVEIEKFGKPKLGAYPIHLHVLRGVTAGTLTLNANSVHHSFNKCFTIHSTESVTIENNVCARIIGHIFYQEIGDEKGITFRNNLGLGAMSHYFDVHADTEAKRQDLISKYFWSGDHLAVQNGYNGFNVVNGDAQDTPTRGSCVTIRATDGGLAPDGESPCGGERLYVEPASGFWIINPATNLIGNSIAGCQGVGRAFWYVPPSRFDEQKFPPALKDLKWQPVGTFQDNRAHGCYAGLYGEPENTIISEQLFPRRNGEPGGPSKFALFDSFTATRNRDRGVWIRPTWYVVTNARLATNKHSISLVTSGGVDGNAPGVWSLLSESVVVGVSQNNVDRFGPCPTGNPSGLASTFGCVDQTRIPNGQPLKGGDDAGRGYPDFTNGKNLFGYLIYDGPARIFNNRFVNFLWGDDLKRELTTADKNALEKGGPQYEGDAALGWFNSNPSSYPTATSSSGLVFENVTLRHQVFTDKVNTGQFSDGDKNTAILDLDGSLGGYVVADLTKKKVEGAFAVSLNNLPFNATGNAVAECLALGVQDKALEAGRPTALMSPASIGQLEFSALYPYPPEDDPNWDAQKGPIHHCQANHWQVIRFTKDSKDFTKHQSMELFGRNGQGIWEPKVADGHGYTVTAHPGKPQVDPPAWCKPAGTKAGIPTVITFGVADIVKPKISATNPFWVRLGICYTSSHATKQHPSGPELFTVERGYKSYGGGNAQSNDPGLRKFWNQLDNRYQNQYCINLNDGQRQSDRTLENLGLSKNLLPNVGCPADGVTPRFDNDTCLDAVATKDQDQQGVDACIYKKTKLESVASIDGLTKAGKPVLDKYFYDATRGWLFVNVAQEFPNAHGPSPLADCPGHAACPNLAVGESYYPCPPQGCIEYSVRLKNDDGSYVPAESNCGDPYGPYVQEPRPAGDFQLVYADKQTVAVQANPAGTTDFPFYAPAEEPSCPVTTPAPTVDATP